MEERNEGVFLRCMGSLSRSAVDQLGSGQFEDMCKETGVKAIMSYDNVVHISGSLVGLQRFEKLMIARQGGSASAYNEQDQSPRSVARHKEECVEGWVEHIPVDAEKLFAAVTENPKFLSQCSQSGARAHFPALCVEGPPRQRAEVVARLQEELERFCVLRKSTLEEKRESRISSHRWNSSKDVNPSRASLNDLSLRRTQEGRASGSPYSIPRPSYPAALQNGGTALMRWQPGGGNLCIEVRFGDITHELVDAIVNPANERLMHIGGVAAAIVEAGGESIIDQSNEIVRRGGELGVTEVVQTGAGLLPCQHILHAVGPRWSHTAGEVECRLLLDTVVNILRMAQDLRCQSIAIPAISSGIFGMPLAECTKSFMSAIRAFSQRNRNTCLQMIHLVNNDEKTCMAFCRQLSFERGSMVGENGIQFVHPNAQLALSCNMDTFSSVSGSTNSLQSHRSSAGSSSNGSRHSTRTIVDEKNSVCPVCLGRMVNPVRLSKCPHVFCSSCWDSAFKTRPVCPVCKVSYGEQTGNQPTGEMTVNKTLKSLPGYEGCGTIQITYVFDSGIQGSEHPSPGQRYHGTIRQAYLPDSAEGQNVLRMLRQAWDARLIFTIGTSVTTGAKDQIVWNDIHHKTNFSGGPANYGYPDPTYLTRVHEELVAKGIF